MANRNECFSDFSKQKTAKEVGLDTNIPKNALKIYPEILNFFPKNPSKSL